MLNSSKVAAYPAAEDGITVTSHQCLVLPALCLFFFFFLSFFLKNILFIYERHREQEREKGGEAETQAEGEAGSMQGA